VCLRARVGGGFELKWTGVPRVTVTPSTENVGQNNTNPFPAFNNHFFLKMSIQDPGQPEKILYYDASYGKTYTSIQDMEDKSISGFYKTRIPNANTPTIRTFTVKMNDPRVLELFAEEKPMR
jgi:hypothetical protein